MRVLMLVIISLLTQGCCSYDNSSSSHTTHNGTYTLYWNEGWGLTRKLDGLSYNECMDLGNTVYTVNGYSCVEENRRYCNTKVQVGIMARGRIRL
jgi:uncharacterized protein YceK